MHSSRMRTGRSLTVYCSLLPGGGVPGPGGAGPGGCLLPGGVSGGGVSQHALRQTPLPPVDRHTLVKTLPWPNFVAAGKKEFKTNPASKLEETNYCDCSIVSNTEKLNGHSNLIEINTFFVKYLSMLRNNKKIRHCTRKHSSKWRSVRSPPVYTSGSNSGVLRCQGVLK